MLFYSKLIEFRQSIKYIYFIKFTNPYRTLKMDEKNKCDLKEISEGLATIKTRGNVFYNPVQEFNRDLRLVQFFFQK